MKVNPKGLEVAEVLRRFHRTELRTTDAVILATLGGVVDENFEVVIKTGLLANLAHLTRPTVTAALQRLEKARIISSSAWQNPIGSEDRALTKKYRLNIEDYELFCERMGLNPHGVQ